MDISPYANSASTQVNGIPLDSATLQACRQARQQLATLLSDLMDMNKAGAYADDDRWQARVKEALEALTDLFLMAPKDKLSTSASMAMLREFVPFVHCISSHAAWPDGQDTLELALKALKESLEKESSEQVSYGMKLDSEARERRALEYLRASNHYSVVHGLSQTQCTVPPWRVLVSFDLGIDHITSWKSTGQLEYANRVHPEVYFTSSTSSLHPVD